MVYCIAMVYDMLLTGDIVVTLVRAPLEVIAGVAYGIVLGLLLWFLPSTDDVSVAL
jgi:ABC-type nitrate/sulfonate/bicarbonate transport system permease component